MKIEITSEQFNLIQNEIIRLEEEDLVQTRIENDTWGIIAVEDKIAILKKILESEEIDLNKLN
jgi:hypothetical protein